MEIRPGMSLLQALSRVTEPKPVPFAQRLAELRGDAPSAAPRTTQTQAAAPEVSRETPPRAESAGPARPRGSVVNILV